VSSERCRGCRDAPLFGFRSLDVGKIIFVAAPNVGAILAGSKCIGDIVATNLLNFLPSNSATEIL